MGNNYQIEGIDNNERTGLLQVLITPAEAIQQVSVSTTNHDPELGRSTGAVVNLIIRSGTNNYHGAAYEFLQNSAFDARAFFNPSVGHLAYNYVGGNLGGPIKHNKLFFFSTICAPWTTRQTPTWSVSQRCIPHRRSFQRSHRRH